MDYDPTFKFTGLTVPEVNLTRIRKPLGRALPRGMGDRRYFQEFQTRMPFDPEVNQFMDDDYLQRYYPEPVVPQAKPRRVPTGMADRKAGAPVQPVIAPSQQAILADQARRQQSQLNVPQRPEQEEGFLQKLYADPSSARGKALQAAAATALQLSGYQNKPVTTGEVLGAMMRSASDAYGKQEAIDLAAQQREQDLMLAMAKAGFDKSEAAKEAKRKADEKQVDREMQLSKQFKDNSKAFGDARLNYERIVQNATTKNPSGASDIALIFNFMKMLDPTSVVRESEYEAAQGASPLMLRLGMQYNRLLRGEDEQLPAATRQQFFQTATETYTAYVDGQRRREADAIEEAEAFDLRADKVVRTKVPELGTKEFPHLVYSSAEAEALPSGSYLLFNGQFLQVK